MNKPNIEKEIKKQGNLISGFSAFLMLGSVTIGAINMPIISTLMVCGAMIPLAIDTISLKFLIEKPKDDIHKLYLLGNSFRKRVSKWIINYIDNSENLTEKKYKVACLSLWMRHRGMKVEKFVNTEIFSNLSKELFDKKEISQYFSLSYLFGDSKDAIKDIYKIDISVKAFLEDDKNDSEKINIAKEVYKEYSQLGMAAKAYLERNNYEELFILQDYKLTEQDYNLIEFYIENVKKGNEHNYKKVLAKLLFSEEAKHAMHKIIEIEDNIDNLKKLENYCLCLGHKTGFEQLALIAEKRIEFLKLDNELEIQEDKNIKNRTKKNKI